ncbi:MAG: DVU0298 family protein [Planctomycetota bacterium]
MKKRLHQLLEQRETNEISDLAAGRRRVLGVLTSLTYDPDPLIVWRAIEAMGVAAGRIARDDPEFVRNHLRRLLWLISEESGGQCWRAPEAMAEIVVLRPDLFGEYAPIVVFLLREMADEDLDYFRPGVLWAIGRLGALADEHIPEVLDAITGALDDADPQARGMAVWCLGQIGRSDLLAARPDLADDEGPVELYEDGGLKRTSVGCLSRRALGS